MASGEEEAEDERGQYEESEEEAEDDEDEDEDEDEDYGTLETWSYERLPEMWQRMRRSYESGDLFALATEIIDAELLRASSAIHKLLNEDPRQVFANLLHLFAFSPVSVLRSCVERTLAADLADPESVTATTAEAMTAEGGGGIYAIYIVLADGNSPSPTQYSAIVDDLIRYAKHNPSTADNYWAASVDQKIPSKNWSAQQSLDGNRRYFDFGKSTRNERGRRVTLRFGRDLRRRCLASTDQNSPLFPPIADVGWSKAMKDRMKAHFRHYSSTYLLSLVHVLLLMRYTGVRQLQTVIQFVSHPLEASLGEMAYTQLLGSHAEGAMGYNHTTAGYSCSSAIDNMNEMDWILQRKLASQYGPDALSIMRKADRLVEYTMAETRRRGEAEEQERKRKLEDLKEEASNMKRLVLHQGQMLTLLAAESSKDS